MVTVTVKTILFSSIWISASILFSSFSLSNSHQLFCNFSTTYDDPTNVFKREKKTNFARDEEDYLLEILFFIKHIYTCVPIFFLLRSLIQSRFFTVALFLFYSYKCVCIFLLFFSIYCICVCVSLLTPRMKLFDTREFTKTRKILVTIKVYLNVTKYACFQLSNECTFEWWKWVHSLYA